MKTMQERQAYMKILEAKKEDPRYQRVIGRLVREKLLFTPRVPPSNAHPTVEEALWVGEIEFRVLELLPAIILRRPKLFMQTKPLPEDLAQVVFELRRGHPETVFRDVEPQKYAYWAEYLGRGGKGITIAKTHRFTREDIESMEKLKKLWNLDETAVIRESLARALQGPLGAKEKNEEV